MFDLEREVAAWSASVHAERCQPEAGIAELTDHLYCEIELARAAGLSEEEAFRSATAKLGSTAELAAEHVKNRSALGDACQLAAKLEGKTPLNRQQRQLVLVHAVIWAVLIIVASLILSKTVVEWLLVVAFVPLWWASEQILLRAVAPEGRTR